MGTICTKLTIDLTHPHHPYQQYFGRALIAPGPSALDLSPIHTGIGSRFVNMAYHKQVFLEQNLTNNNRAK